MEIAECLKLLLSVSMVATLQMTESGSKRRGGVRFGDGAGELKYYLAAKIVEE